MNEPPQEEPAPGKLDPARQPVEAGPAALPQKPVVEPSPTPVSPPKEVSPPDAGPGKPKASGSGGPREGQAFTVPGLSLEMVWCKPGTFMMGSPESEEGRGSNETLRSMTLTKGFWLGKHEVTQAQWQEVTGSSPSQFKGDDLPVESVSWHDATSFCKKLTELERAAGRVSGDWAYQLPLEAQWEYACRAGTTTAWSFGNNPDELWRHGNYADKNTNFSWGDRLHDDGHENTARVGSCQANGWGFYDMHGNVWEWCHDWHGEYPGAPVGDPRGPATGTDRILRGGSWNFQAALSRSAIRFRFLPGKRLNNLGFRVSLRSNGGQAE